jgi:hypothetical protein
MYVLAEVRGAIRSVDTRHPYRRLGGLPQKRETRN